MNAHVTDYNLYVVTIIEGIKTDYVSGKYTGGDHAASFCAAACDSGIVFLHGRIASNEGFWEPELAVFA